MSTAAPAPHAAGHARDRTDADATLWAMVAFAVSGVVVASATGSDRRALAVEAGSLEPWAAGAAAIGAALAFAAAAALARRRSHDRPPHPRPFVRRAFDVTVLAAATAALAYLAVVATARVFQAGFLGLTVDALGAGVLAGAATAVVTYLAWLLGARVTTVRIAILATLTLFVGTLASMLTTPEARWWEFHFSQLGNQAGTSGDTFNTTLVFAGLILVVLAGSVRADLDRGLAARGAHDPRLVRRLVVLLSFVGVLMSIAGMVPDGLSIVVHVGAASGMVVVWGIFSVVLVRRLPGVPNEFRVYTVASMAAVVVAALLWIPIGYYNLTGVEFVAASVLFAWLTVFARTMSDYAHAHAHLAVDPA